MGRLLPARRPAVAEEAGVIHPAIDLSSVRPSAEALTTAALRCWARARGTGVAAVPRLHRLLATSGPSMLAPALDSLLQLFQTRLGRPLVAGVTAMSEDEMLLLDLLARADGIATPLDSALCSLRAMLREERESLATG
ncbi:hypothetical protein SAMN05428974_0437 [Sphingopyxis sp. YR583]|nr:hypothetical protein SAMN05428974_0437 [Sphingopyxis sp. YR583]